MKKTCNRRAFLRNAWLGGAGFLILKNSRSAFGAPANTQLNIALIGVGGRARAFLSDEPGCCSVTCEGHRVAALCDVNEQKAGDAFRLFPDAIKGHDYRLMLDKYHKEIDAVIVAASDHAHAPASAAAMRAGKHVYCEKPLTRLVYESRRLSELAAGSKVVTQMGNQAGYNPKTVNMVWSGMAGEIREAHCWIVGGGAGKRPAPSGKHEIPETMKWDLWLGPAAWREYDPAWWTQWNSWRDFGTCGLGNRGAHSMATVFKALKIDELWEQPAGESRRIKCSAECSELCVETFPKWYKIKWEIPARAGMAPAVVYWHSGELDKIGSRAMFEDLIGRKLNMGGAGETWDDFLGSIIVGEKGLIHCGQYAGFIEALPKDKFEGAEPPQMLPAGGGGPGVKAWLRAILGNAPKPMSSFDTFSGKYSEFYLLGHAATLFPGETLEFDPAGCRILNNSLADLALRPEYRQGWTL